MNRKRQLPLVRVFADNGRWWLLNVGEEPVRDVTVTVQVDSERVIIDDLSTPMLAIGEQRCVASAQLSSDAMMRVDVCWQDATGSVERYDVNLPADGLRAESSV